MADTLRDRAVKALVPFFGDGVVGTPEFQAGRMADAVLAVVEAHTRQAQVEAWTRAVAFVCTLTGTDNYGWEQHNPYSADELDPKGDGQ